MVNAPMTSQNLKSQASGLFINKSLQQIILLDGGFSSIPPTQPNILQLLSTYNLNYLLCFRPDLIACKIADKISEHTTNSVMFIVSICHHVLFNKESCIPLSLTNKLLLDIVATNAQDFYACVIDSVFQFPIGLCRFSKSYKFCIVSLFFCLLHIFVNNQSTIGAKFSS